MFDQALVSQMKNTKDEIKNIHLSALSMILVFKLVSFICSAYFEKEPALFWQTQVVRHHLVGVTENCSYDCGLG